jgi:hypothetical protein
MKAFAGKLGSAFPVPLSRADAGLDGGQTKSRRLKGAGAARNEIFFAPRLAARRSLDYFCKLA